MLLITITIVNIRTFISLYRTASQLSLTPTPPSSLPPPPFPPLQLLLPPPPALPPPLLLLMPLIFSSSELELNPKRVMGQINIGEKYCQICEKERARVCEEEIDRDDDDAVGRDR